MQNMVFIKKSRPVDIFPDFKKGYSAFGMNNGTFSFGDVIEYVLNHIGPADALISSWVASSKSVRKVLKYLNNKKFLSVKFLLDRMFANTRPEIYKHIIDNFGADCIRTSRLHMKFCALYNADWSVVIETSANLNKNIRLETFRITEDKKFLDFFKEFFDNIFGTFPPQGNASNAQIFSESDLQLLPNIPKNVKPKRIIETSSVPLSASQNENFDFDFDKKWHS